MKRRYYKRMIGFIASLVSLSLLTSFSGCIYGRNGKHLLDYPNVWSCEDDEFKLEFTTTGFNGDYCIPATLYLDGEAIEVKLILYWQPPTLIEIYLPEDYVEGKVDREKIFIEVYYNYSHLSLECNAKTALTFEIAKDNTNREGKESLVGRKFVFYNRPIAPPEA